MAAIGYRDIGVYQHKAEGGDAAKTGYVDIGVYQHADSVAAGVTYPQLERFGLRGVERGIQTGVR